MKKESTFSKSEYIDSPRSDHFLFFLCMCELIFFYLCISKSEYMD